MIRRLALVVICLAIIATLLVAVAGGRLLPNLWKSQDGQSPLARHFQIINCNQPSFESLPWYKPAYYGRCLKLIEASRQKRLPIQNDHSRVISFYEATWLVNVGWDNKLYAAKKAVANPRSLLVLINKQHRLPDGFAPKHIVSINSSRGATMEKAAAAGFKKMQAAARADGIALDARNGYRDEAWQSALYNSYVAADGRAGADEYSARPGYSEHQTGLATDVMSGNEEISIFKNTAASTWVDANCHRFGFIVRYTAANQWVTGYGAEAWHLRYIGEEASRAYHQKGCGSLEEFLGKGIGTW